MTYFYTKFKDGNTFIALEEEVKHSQGCITCDFGSEYINRFSFVTTNYFVDVEFNQMYEYAVSVGDVVKILAVELGNFTEREFVEYVQDRFEGLAKEKAAEQSNGQSPLKKLEIRERKNG